MKKSKMKNRLLFFSCVLSGMMLGGCTDGDYKISSVDATFGVGNGNLKLPSNSSFVVTLDDILDLGSTDLITVNAADGDYIFGKDPEGISPVNVKVDPITVDADKSEKYDFSFNLPSEVMSLPAGSSVDCSTLPADVQAQLTHKDNVYKMEYDFNVPAEVKALEYVSIGGDNGVNLKLTLSMPTMVSESDLQIDFPDVLDIPSGVEAGNILKVTNLSGSKVINLTVKGIKLSAKESAKADDYAYLDNGKFKMLGLVKLTLKINKLVVPSSPAVNVGATIDMGSISVSQATGKFKPTISAQEVGSTTITSLPDFLTDARVVADIDNPQICLDIESNLPLGGTVEAKLGSSTLNGYVELSKAKGNALKIAANTTTKIVVCRKASAVPPGYTPVIASDLSNIVKKLAEGMKITTEITSFDADDVTTTFLLGNNYTFKPNYKFNARLALGDQAEVVYKETEDDWNKDLKDFQLTSASKVFLTASVNNGVPADLEINIKPLDVKGNELTGLIVTPIQKMVPAGETAGTIKYEITDPQGQGLKQLNGVEYELLVKAPSASTEKGKALNKNQKITIKTTDLQLNGKVIIDAN